MTDERLLGDIRKWLDRNGYVFEMEVARAASRHARWVFQGRPYSDRKTGTVRETDVLAIWFPEAPPMATLHAITVVFECKGSPEPWVFFEGHSELANGLPTRYASPDCDVCVKLRCAALDEVFGECNPQAYAVVQKRNPDKDRNPGRGGFDHAWEAVQQVTSAAIGISTWPEEQEGHVERQASELIIPVVVTKSPLVMCALDGDGEVSLRLSDRAQIGVPTQGLPGENEWVPVCVITHSALDDLLNRVTGLSADYEWED